MPSVSGKATEGVDNGAAGRAALTGMTGRRGPTIAISGPPGCGKTTYAKRLAKDLGLDYLSAGMFFRTLAKQRGMSLEEFSRLAEKDPTIDLEIDRMTLEAGLKGGVVVEGHLVAWVLRYVADVKIYITAPLHVRVRRIAEREGRDLSEVLRETIVREQSNWSRFREYYGYDVTDLSFFDLVVDNTYLSIEETYGIIKGFVEKRLAKTGIYTAHRNT